MNTMLRFVLLCILVALPRNVMALPGASAARHAGPDREAVPCGSQRNIMGFAEGWYPLEIEVRDKMGNLISGAEVTIIPLESGERIPAVFDGGREIYYLDIAHVTYVTVEIVHSDFNTARRLVKLVSVQTVVNVTLFQPGDNIAYVGDGELWYIPKPDTIGFLANLVDDAKSKNGRKKNRREIPARVQDPVARIAAATRMKPQQIQLLGGGMEGDGHYWGIIVLTPQQAGEKGKLLAALRGNPVIAAAGPLYYLSNWSYGGESMRIFTNYISLVFFSNVPAEEISSFMEQRGLTPVTYFRDGNTYMVRVPPETGEEINDIVREIRASGRVIYASVEIAGPVSIDYDN